MISVPRNLHPDTGNRKEVEDEANPEESATATEVKETKREPVGELLSPRCPLCHYVLWVTLRHGQIVWRCGGCP